MRLRLKVRAGCLRSAPREPKKPSAFHSHVSLFRYEGAVPTHALSGRLSRGKKGKPLRPSKLAGRSGARRTRLRRRASGRAHTSATRRASNQPAATSAPRTESRAPNGKPEFPQRWREFPAPGHALADFAPEERELRQKRTELCAVESELAVQQSQLSRLQSEMLPFEARYVRRVGIRCARLDAVEARIAEIHASVRPEDPAAQDAARQARERANRSRRAILRRTQKEKVDPPPALKRLYRAVARRVHPDLSGSAADRQLRERLMARANRAYASGDEPRLQAIVREYEFCPETVQGEGTPADLVRVIRKIAQSQERLQEVRDEMEKIRSSDLYRFKLLVEAKAKQGRDVFAEVVAAVNTRIAAALLRLKNLEAAIRQGAA
jgi:hypothetical protein